MSKLGKHQGYSKNEVKSCSSSNGYCKTTWKIISPTAYNRCNAGSKQGVEHWVIFLGNSADRLLLNEVKGGR